MMGPFHSPTSPPTPLAHRHAAPLAVLYFLTWSQCSASLIQGKPVLLPLWALAWDEGKGRWGLF